MKKNHAVSVIGLGKLGLPTAVFFAMKGCMVLGMDLCKKLVDNLKNGIIESDEPNLREMYEASKERISFTDSVSEAIASSEITFVIVPTPSLPSGEFSAHLVRSVSREIGVALRHKRAWHTVVLVSTVMPGSTRQDMVRVIEEASGKTVGEKFGVCYSPEFIALGSVLHDLAHPSFMLIGQSDARSGFELEEFYKRIIEDTVPVRRMNLTNAELVKIAINTFITTKISYANMLAGICESVSDLDVAIVTEAIGQDRRIGTSYLKGGLGYGGPCFPRDNKALKRFAEQLGAQADLAVATDTINGMQTSRLIARIYRLCGRDSFFMNKKIAVIGLSYKQYTDVIEKSPGVEIVQSLLSEECIDVSVFDRPKTLENARDLFKNRVKYASSCSEAVESAQIVIVAVSDKELMQDFPLQKGVSWEVFVDPWRLFDRSLLPRQTKYCTVGRM